MLRPTEHPYRLLTPGPSRMLVSVPHAGRRYDWLELMPTQPKASLATLRRGEDPYVETLALPLARAGFPTLIQLAPRAVIDVNRAPWEMASAQIAGVERTTQKLFESAKAHQGLGLVPTRLAADDLYDAPLTVDDVAWRTRAFHGPYHSQLSALMDESQQKFGKVLVLDLHSMPRLRRQPFASPHFVLGNRHGASCPDWLLASAAKALRDQGYSVTCNQPYAGGYVIQHHAQPERGRFALQIEICRSLYLTPQAQRSLPGARPSNGRRARSLSQTGCHALRRLLLELVQRLNAGLVEPSSRSKAAE